MINDKLDAQYGSDEQRHGSTTFHHLFVHM